MEKQSIIVTREYLYRLVSDNFDLIDKFLELKQNKEHIIGIFNDSAVIVSFLEEFIQGDDYELLNLSDNHISLLLKRINNDDFREYIGASIKKKYYLMTEKNNRTNSKSLVLHILKEVSTYQNKMIEQNFKKKWFNEDQDNSKNKKHQTFLSYAYYDKGISLALFIYFMMNGGFLYVNWMWSGVNSNSGITKNQLDEELGQSIQFLFLRTINSELDYYASSHIRQWCSWEIGNYYTKRKNSKYYLNFYGKGSGKNDLLSTFTIFRYVKNGIING